MAAVREFFAKATTSTERSSNENVVAGHLYVTAQGDRADAVIGAAPANPPKARGKAHRKNLDAHAEQLGGDKMADLVYQDHGPQHEYDPDESAHEAVLPF